MSALPDVQAANTQSMYNIGVVTRLTGISIATLRAWERRYGFPQSERTSGGHRLYSDQDVVRLRWVKARIDEGMQTAQAIQALHYQDHTPPLSERGNPVMAQVDAAATEECSQRLVADLLRHDTTQADVTLGDALALWHPETIILDVIGPALVQIGDAWAGRRIDVATEHLATNYLRHVLLMWMESGPPPSPARPIVLACAPGEWHEGGLLMIGALLRRSHWPVAYLGQSVPLADLATIVRDLSPAMIVITATSAEAASALSEWPQHLPEAARSGHPAICYAGRIFDQSPEWRERVQGVYLGATLRDGWRAIERVLG